MTEPRSPSASAMKGALSELVEQAVNDLRVICADEKDPFTVTLQHVDHGEIVGEPEPAIYKLLTKLVADASAAERVPGGYKIVPIEPTQGMLLAYSKAIRNHLNSLTDHERGQKYGVTTATGYNVGAREKAILRYRAMIAAAPLVETGWRDKEGKTTNNGGNNA